MILAYGICLFRYRKVPNKHVQPIAANAATASTSLTLLWGVFDPTVLKLIGATIPYIIAAGLTGIAHSINALFEDRSA